MGTEDPDPAAETIPAREPGEPEGAVEVGATLGRYRLVEQLGVCGMGVVYRARDPALQRELAIKVVKPRIAGADAQARLQREARAMARLRHPNVVPVFDVGIVGDSVFVVMPHLAGGTLSGWLRSEQRSWRQVVESFVAAGRGLAVAHAAGLVHRDFKPDNVLLGVDGEIQVADFGLARLATEDGARRASHAPIGNLELTFTGDLLGTPAYMAPEQLRGETVDARADVFSFCVALYEGLFGARPFVATSPGPAALVELIEAIENGAIRDPGDRKVPAWLKAAVVVGLRARPEARWQSMRALLDHLQRRMLRRRRVGIVSGALAGAAAIAGLALVFLGHAPPATPETRTYRTVALSTSGDVRIAALSPDRRQVAALAGHDLLVFDLHASTAPRVVATDVAVDADELAWAPDGSKLVYGRDAPGAPVSSYVDLASGVIHALEGAHTHIFTGPDEITAWDVAERQLVRTAVSASSANPTTCRVTGAFVWLEQVVPTPSGDMWIAAASGSLNDPMDQVLRTDRACTATDTIATGLALRAIAPLTDGDKLVALSERRPRTQLVEIDRAGHVQRTPAPEGAAKLAGIGSAGEIVFIRETRSWQLLRATSGRALADVDNGTGRVVMELAPDGRRLATLDDDGELRIVDLDQPRVASLPIDHGATAVDWSPDSRRLALLVHRDDRSVLVIEDADGTHRSERAAPAIPQEEIHWLDSDSVAVPRTDMRTYLVVDLKTGATRELVDASKGWTSDLVRAPTDGRLLVAWMRPAADSGIWLVAADRDPELVEPDREGRAHALWSADGRGMFLYTRDSDTIEQVDLASRRRSTYTTLAPDRRARIAQVFALANGDLLVLRERVLSDLAVATW